MTTQPMDVVRDEHALLDHVRERLHFGLWLSHVHELHTWCQTVSSNPS